MTSYVLLFLLVFLLDRLFDSPCVSRFYRRVCQQQYLLLLLLLLYARVLIIKSYNQLLQIFHLLSWAFSPFLQFSWIMYCQSQVPFTTLDILFELFFCLPFSYASDWFYSWRLCWKGKRIWQVLYIFPFSILNIQATSLCPFTLQWLHSLMPCFFFFFSIFRPSHRH